MGARLSDGATLHRGVVNGVQIEVIKFDEYLKEFESEDFAMDYWYDEGFVIAQGMLEKFSEENWNELLKNLNNKTVEWKKRLAYCLHDENSLWQLKVLIELLDTEDEELFELSVDSMRTFINANTKSEILQKSTIITRIKERLPSVGKPIKIILEDFLTKIE